MKTFAYLRAQTADQAPHLLASQLKNYSESYSENHLEDHENSDDIEISKRAK